MGPDGRDPAPLNAVAGRPFLLLSSRPEDAAAEQEHASFLRFTGLPADRLHRIRLEAGPLPELDLDAYAGVVLGGSPFNSSDPPESKSAVQLRVEREVDALLGEVVARDVPFLGACYGIGTLGTHLGGVVDRTYGEPVSAVEVSLTEEGRRDPLLAGVPERFGAFVGHKEACRELPPGAVLLASSATCPVQMFRVRQNVYATQFHPELDVDGLVARARIYQHAGYFPPDELDQVVALAEAAEVHEPARVLANFVARYG
ncbi:glutamine amidotransferase [Blastococcus sp. LR1]|uniref:glutamine amidotransferase n=1 Tax=Blastococcus sp. LR1 TaxID=2877000 RepID=UPI001CCA610E|nr:glutamine amidotransferase [Blastococcus sp. LR1]MCA0146487.1 glutamine amidotransferase [Blastococcus sp. LR1]